MSLSTAQRAIVQTTFAQVADADLLATRFYTRLFEIDPSTRPLFTHDMAEQRQKLIQILVIVVNNLDDLSPLIPAIQNLGKRHVTYGVTTAHWNSVGSALLFALEEDFGEAFTNEVREAWGIAYRIIAKTALDAAHVNV